MKHIFGILFRWKAILLIVVIVKLRPWFNVTDLPTGAQLQSQFSENIRAFNLHDVWFWITSQF